MARHRAKYLLALPIFFHPSQKFTFQSIDKKKSAKKCLIPQKNFFPNSARINKRPAISGNNFTANKILSTILARLLQFYFGISSAVLEFYNKVLALSQSRKRNDIASLEIALLRRDNENGAIFMLLCTRVILFSSSRDNGELTVGSHKSAKKLINFCSSWPMKTRSIKSVCGGILVSKIFANLTRRGSEITYLQRAGGD